MSDKRKSETKRCSPPSVLAEGGVSLSAGGRFRPSGNGKVRGVLPRARKECLHHEKTFALLLALVMALALVACGQKEDNSGGETKDDQTQTDGQTVDLRAAYEAGIKQVQEELGDNAPVLLEETAVEILNSYYPGLENAKLKQSVFFISPTATSCEVSMVEAESAADAEIARQSFQARVDAMADDTTYPEEAGMWKNNATVTVNGNYVVLEVLPDGCTVPDAFLAKF